MNELCGHNVRKTRNRREKANRQFMNRQTNKEEKSAKLAEETERKIIMLQRIAFVKYC